MKKAIIAGLLISCLTFCACSAQKKDDAQTTDTTAADEQSTVQAGDTTDNTTAQDKDTADTTAKETLTDSDNAVFLTGMKEYMLEKSAELKWSKAFINAIDFDEQYEKYLAKDGAKEDKDAFAEYLTKNAPVPENWKELFAADLAEEYQYTPVTYTDNGDGTYSVTVKIDGEEKPFVTVDSRTGWYHG